MEILRVSPVNTTNEAGDGETKYTVSDLKVEVGKVYDPTMQMSSELYRDKPMELQQGLYSANAQFLCWSYEATGFEDTITSSVKRILTKAWEGYLIVAQDTSISIDDRIKIIENAVLGGLHNGAIVDSVKDFAPIANAYPSNMLDAINAFVFSDVNGRIEISTGMNNPKNNDPSSYSLLLTDAIKTTISNITG